MCVCVFALYNSALTVTVSFNLFSQTNKVSQAGTDNWVSGRDLWKFKKGRKERGEMRSHWQCQWTKWKGKKKRINTPKNRALMTVMRWWTPKTTESSYSLKWERVCVCVFKEEICLLLWLKGRWLFVLFCLPLLYMVIYWQLNKQKHLPFFCEQHLRDRKINRWGIKSYGKNMMFMVKQLGNKRGKMEATSFYEKHNYKLVIHHFLNFILVEIGTIILQLIKQQISIAIVLKSVFIVI